ncbi:hypothetical protein J3459_008643 [Metarhizium acridum]|nr:hypothetical protein J3459_008643 [Metarhizium acridum]
MGIMNLYILGIWGSGEEINEPIESIIYIPTFKRIHHVQGPSSHNESLSDRETRPFVEDPALEKRLVAKFRTHADDANVGRILRKVDMRLIPMLSVMRGVLLFMSNWYKKSELARRFSIFYCASLGSGAVGGLIGMCSQGLTQMYMRELTRDSWSDTNNMQNRDGLPAWKVAVPEYVFLVQRSLS